MTDPAIKTPKPETTPHTTPGWRPVAVIDIGASAIRMRIAEIGPNGEVRNLDSLQQALRLGKDTFSAAASSHRRLKIASRYCSVSVV